MPVEPDASFASTCTQAALQEQVKPSRATRTALDSVPMGGICSAEPWTLTNGSSCQPRTPVTHHALHKTFQEETEREERVGDENGEADCPRCEGDSSASREVFRPVKQA